MFASKSLFLLATISAICRARDAGAADFIAGADMSHLVFFEDRGIAYKDGAQTQDALILLRNRGLNCVRLRLFTSSAAQAQADPYNYTNNLAYTLPLAVRVKNAGLKFLLDFHYSDTWADPGHQAKPADWTNLTFTQLVQQMRTYNSNCLTAFKSAGALPDYVQVGNEITGGMLWPDGANNSSAQWVKLGQLMKAAIQGIQDASGTQMPKIMVHIDRGGDWNTTQWFFDNLLQQSVPFDIIGESYYPWWHGSLDDLRNCLTNTANRYGKPIFVAETAFPWSGTSNIYGIPPTTNGQVNFVVALAQIVKGLPGGLGAGIFWWGTEYQKLAGYNLAGFDKDSFFSSGSAGPLPAGNVLPVADAFGQMAGPPILSASLSGAELNLTWPLGGAGMSLATTTDLAPLAGWVLATNAVQNTGTVFSSTVPTDGRQHFYRLQSN